MAPEVFRLVLFGVFAGTMLAHVVIAVTLGIRGTPLSAMQRVGMVLMAAGTIMAYYGANWPFPLDLVGPAACYLGFYCFWRPPDDWWRRRRQRMEAVNLRVRRVLARGVPAMPTEPEVQLHRTAQFMWRHRRLPKTGDQVWDQSDGHYYLYLPRFTSSRQLRVAGPGRWTPLR
jgi:hypothetical protein